MAKKNKTVFVCQECGNESSKWVGQCICGAWNSMVEEKVIKNYEEDSRSRKGIAIDGTKREKADAILLHAVKSGDIDRMDTGISELNRVLGGGLVKGSLVLISGEPGIGKSTVILQASSNIAKKYGNVLYISGEESETQIKMRADRICKLKEEELYILSETNMENIIDVIVKTKPKFIIIDSIQTMYTAEIESAPGSVSQVRTCGNLLMKIGKGSNIPIFIVAHVNKTGELAGPKTVEHMVDCVLNFYGERNHDLRILRAFKNRFGTTSEIGAFEMTEEGLKEISNLSENFLDADIDKNEGAVTSAVYEGSRPLLLEIQALTSYTGAGFARRNAIGVDNNRLNMLLAIIEKKVGVKLYDQDVYVNVVGGIKPDGTSIDLAVVIAILSSLKGFIVDKQTLILGEVGLTGEVRPIQDSEKIVREAEKLGFKKVILPYKNMVKIKQIGNIQIIGVKNIKDVAKSLV